MILAGIATYFNSRASVARQSPEAAANPQTAMMNKLALYVFPLGVVVGGPFLPLAIIMYWLANNIWTFGQQHYVFGKIEKEEEAKKLEAQERRAQNAPPPGRQTEAAEQDSGDNDEWCGRTGVIGDRAGDRWQRRRNPARVSRARAAQRRTARRARERRPAPARDPRNANVDRPARTCAGGTPHASGGPTRPKGRGSRE